MPSARPLRLAAAVLLLLPAFAAAARPIDLALAEPGCPAVTPDLLPAFLTNADGTRPLTRDQAAALACHLTPLLAHAAAGNASAQDALADMYLSWRQAFAPQVWGGMLAASKAQWTDNLRAVVAINSDPTSRFWAGLNAYSAMSSDAFAAAGLMTPPAPAPRTSSLAGALVALASTLSKKGKGGNRKLQAWIPVTRYPASVNWFAAGKVLPQAGFQASCGSSWAFAAAAALESKLMIDTATLANATAALSPQQIMDCTARAFAYNASTCSGGNVTDAFQYAADSGVTADAAYRYRWLTPGSDGGNRAFQLQCDRPFLDALAARAGLVRIVGAPAYKQVSPANNKAALLQALVAQPAVTALAVDASFQHYAGGIWTSTACNATSAPTHTLLLVGYSTQTFGQEHFLAKNSLGAAWGEAGFVRLAMAADGPGLCGMYRAAYQPSAVNATAPTLPSKHDHDHADEKDDEEEEDASAPAASPAPRRSSSDGEQEKPRRSSSDGEHH